jgi:hypothetical protein
MKKEKRKMKLTLPKFLALAVLAVMATALGFTTAHFVPAIHAIHAIHAHMHLALAVGSLSLSLLASTVTIIQTYPIAGTFPTSAQAFYNNTQISRLVAADSDTVAVLTHNWMLSAAQLAAFLPLITYYIQALDSAGVTLPLLTFALTDSNTVTMTKVAATGSGGTYVVTMQRPLSSTL